MVTKEYLNSIFYYKDGKIYWKIKPKNSRPGSDDRAGTFIKGGRRYVTFGKTRMGEHRVIYFMHHGFTDLMIDHKDKDHRNNLIENLRAATKGQNEQNTTKRVTNKSGYKGVSFNKVKQKWRATITADRKCRSLGYYHSPELAHEAYKKAANVLHGEFASW